MTAVSALFKGNYFAEQPWEAEYAEMVGITASMLRFMLAFFASVGIAAGLRFVPTPFGRQPSPLTSLLMIIILQFVCMSCVLIAAGVLSDAISILVCSSSVRTWMSTQLIVAAFTAHFCSKSCVWVHMAISRQLCFYTSCQVHWRQLFCLNSLHCCITECIVWFSARRQSINWFDHPYRLWSCYSVWNEASLNA